MKHSRQSSFSLAVLSLAAAAAAQACPPPQVVVPPFSIPVAAGGWSIQHFGQPLNAGQIEYVLISLPSPVALPLSLFPTVFCNPVGNTPCIYADVSNAVSWFHFGPSSGANATVSLIWPNDPSLAGILFLAQFGVAGCGGTGGAPDLSVLVTGLIV